MNMKLVYSYKHLTLQWYWSRMRGAIPTLTHCAFMAWCSVKQQGQHYLTWVDVPSYEGVSKSFRTESITRYTLTIINTRWETTQRVIAAKLTRLTYKITTQLHLVAESFTICSSRSRRPVRKLLDTPTYTEKRVVESWCNVESAPPDSGSRATLR
jgi:hypothetical protein